MRTSLPFVEILCSRFQEFDHGEHIEQLIPASYRLQTGDQFYWSCAQFDGIAEVVSCAEPEAEYTLCVIKKIT